LLIIPKINFRSILRDIYLAAGCNTAAAFKITIPVVDISVTMGAITEYSDTPDKP